MEGCTICHILRCLQAPTLWHRHLLASRPKKPYSFTPSCFSSSLHSSPALASFRLAWRVLDQLGGGSFLWPCGISTGAWRSVYNRTICIAPHLMFFFHSLPSKHIFSQQKHEDLRLLSYDCPAQKAIMLIHEICRRLFDYHAMPTPKIHGKQSCYGSDWSVE